MDVAASFAGRHRRALLCAAGAGAAGYGIYRFYTHPAVALRRRRLAALFHALLSLSDAAAAGADTLALVAADLSAFIRSDSDEVPQSIRQLGKIAASDDFTAAVESVARSLYRSCFLHRGRSEANGGVDSPSPSLADLVLDKLVSPSGSAFVAAVAGAFAQNLVVGYYSAAPLGGDGGGGMRLMDFLLSVRGKEAVAHCIRVFVSTAVATYLDRTMDDDTCSHVLAAMTDPKHEGKVREMLVLVCNTVVEALVRTSREYAPATADPSSTVSILRNSSQEARCKPEGWVRKVSSTLAVPSNRRLVLDVTGRVTAETVKSCLDFLTQSLTSGATKTISIARNEVVEKGLHTMRCVSAKSMAILTVCIALCMHISIGSKLLVPA